MHSFCFAVNRDRDTEIGINLRFCLNVYHPLGILQIRYRSGEGIPSCTIACAYTQSTYRVACVVYRDRSARRRALRSTCIRCPAVRPRSRVVKYFFNSVSLLILLGYVRLSIDRKPKREENTSNVTHPLTLRLPTLWPPGLAPDMARRVSGLSLHIHQFAPALASGSACSRSSLNVSHDFIPHPLSQ